MFHKVSVLIPTRGRLKRLHDLLCSYQSTTTDYESCSELVFRADEDDHETCEFLRGESVQLVIGPRMQGYHSLPIFFNEMAKAATGDVLMCGNDDMVFQTHGWASFILQAANEYPDGLFDFGVHTHNEDHYPFATVSKKVVEKLGFLWDPAIHWGDIYLRDVMAAFGRTIMLPHVHIDHDWAGWKPDRTFHEGDQNAIYRKDPRYWVETHPRAVNEAVRRLRESL